MSDQALNIFWVVDERAPGGNALLNEFLASLAFATKVIGDSGIYTSYTLYAREALIAEYRARICSFSSRIGRKLFVDILPIQNPYYENIYRSKVDCIFRHISGHDGDFQPKEYGSNLCLFLDCDTIVLQDFVSPLFRLKRNHEFDIALALECGALDCGSVPNYNTGVILFSQNPKDIDLVQRWASSMAERYAANLGDQLLFRRVLFDSLEPLFIHSLHDTCNLRCHQVFDYRSLVWSPISLVHNHIAVQTAYKVLLALSLKYCRQDTTNVLCKGFSIINQYFNPEGKEFVPRAAHVSKSKMIKAFLSAL